MDFLTTHELWPKLSSTTSVYVAVLDKKFSSDAQGVARALRKRGVPVAVDLTERKMAAQIKTAVKKQIPYVLFVGEEEVKNEQYTLKELATETEQKLSLAELAEYLDRR